MSARLIGDVQNRRVWLKWLRLNFLTKKKIRASLYEIGSEHIQEIRDSMAEKKTGRIYNIKGIEHQASAPGESPAILSGTLSRSLYYKVRGSHQLEIGADAKYAGFLESGTSKMAARPFLQPVIDKQRRNTRDSILKYIIEI